MRDLMAAINELSQVADPGILEARMADLLARLPAGMHRQAVTSLAFNNPLFTPGRAYAAENWPGEVGQANAIELILRLKQAARDRQATRILVACPRKVASTFVAKVLCAALRLPEALLTVPVSTLESAWALGANMREQEMDEAAILRACFLADGFVSQQHVRATPYLCAQIRLYAIRPIVLKRNLFDTLVSLDDMLADPAQSGSGEAYYFDTLMPRTYRDMEPDARMALLIRSYLPWYAQFYVSWQKCERLGLVRPLWLSYEDDIKGPADALARKLSLHLGPRADAGAILAAMEAQSGQKRARFNRGVVGRGQAISEQNQRFVRDYLSAYAGAGDLDLTGILDD